MAELTVDLTYGAALFQAAVETNKKDVILSEAEELLDIFVREPDLKAFINYPAISVNEKKKVIAGIFQGKICDELINFLYVLVDKGRTTHFERIIKEYKKLVEREEGCSYGTVYSVIPLTDNRIEVLEKETSRLMKSNVWLTNELDPKLIAGIKILVEGKIVDASIRKRFDELESQII
ncbi:MAG: ATP synthase F1 subunit delta [Clostridiales bacterium]|nr:ATP synthase F1 subunit delta [Clostridiales bacterium]